MDDLATVAGMGLFLSVVPGIIFIVYFVKLSRRLAQLLEILHREAEWRIREKYELPGPTPVPDAPGQ